MEVTSLKFPVDLSVLKRRKRALAAGLEDSKVYATRQQCLISAQEVSPLTAFFHTVWNLQQHHVITGSEG